MTAELFFICIVMIPLFIGGTILTVIQGKFFDRYHRLFHPKEPISMVDFGQLLQKNSKLAFTFLKKNFIRFFFLGWKVYFKKYEDAKLNQLALCVRIIFLIMLLILFIPTIIMFAFL